MGMPAVVLMHCVDTQTFKVQLILGLLPMSLPGYMCLPNDKDSSYEQYINAITPKDIKIKPNKLLS